MNRMIRNLVDGLFLIYFMIVVLPVMGVYEVSDRLNEKRRKKK